MKRTHDLRIQEMKPLISPEELKKELPITPKAAEAVVEEAEESAEPEVIGKGRTEEEESGEE